MPVESVLEMPYSALALWTALLYYAPHPDKRPAASSADSSFEAFKLMMSGKKKHG